MWTHILLREPSFCVCVTCNVCVNVRMQVKKNSYYYCIKVHTGVSSSVVRDRQRCSNCVSVHTRWLSFFLWTNNKAYTIAVRILFPSHSIRLIGKRDRYKGNKKVKKGILRQRQWVCCKYCHLRNTCIKTFNVA